MTETITLQYTGAVEAFVVPAGVDSIFIEANGAQGGGSSGDTAGGLGARMTGDFAVVAGEVLSIVVGQQGLLQTGGNAQNSSGGGGGTFVYRNVGPSLLVAAGGGGGKCNFSSSGPIHAEGAGRITPEGGASSDGNAGGSDGNGGNAGLWSGNPCAGGGTGWLTPGGGPFGGLGYATWTGGPGFGGGGGGGVGGVGGFGGGGGGGNHYGGGGGGGGYSGGGGGTDPTHGGGGGSFSIATSQVNTPGIQSGDGSVTITYTISGTIIPEYGIEAETGKPGVPSLSAPAMQVFPATRRGAASETATVALRNVGNAALERLTMRVSGQASLDFQIRKRPATKLLPGASTNLQIAFAPGGVGHRRASISLVSNAPTKRILLSGKGMRSIVGPRFPFP